MMGTAAPQKRGIAVALGAILVAAVALRLCGLKARTITHVEIYVPGIELPRELADPGPRFTVQDTLRGLLEAEEPHPPAYYLLMLGWTRVLGAGIVALRLPSVLFGVASVLLVYLLGALERKPQAGLIAAAMLAFSGFHIFWSQLAKSYVMACFLGLLSTVLLVLAAREGRRQGLLQILYSVATLIGLATTHYLWPILASHIIWVLSSGGGRKSAPGLLRCQLVTVVLASPLISLAVFQARRPSYLGTNLLAGLGHYLQFGFLLEPDPNSAPAALGLVLGGVVLAAAGLLLLRLGLGSFGSGGREKDSTAGPRTAVVGLSCAVAVAFILGLAWFTRAYDAHQTRLVVASSILPVAVFVLDLVLQKHWERVSTLVTTLRSRPLLPFLLIAGMAGVAVILSAGRLFQVGPQQGPVTRYANLALLSLVLVWLGVCLCLGPRRAGLPGAPSALLAVLPVAMLAGFMPVADLFASRGALAYTPYLFLVTSQGLVAATRKSRLWIVLAALLLVAFSFSVPYYRRSHHEHPTDYQALAEKWIPEIEDSDLIFVQRHWLTTPVFYYLDAERYHFVGAYYPATVRAHPESRVWVVQFESLPMSPAMEKALEGYAPVSVIDARGISAVLYTQPTDGARER